MRLWKNVNRSLPDISRELVEPVVDPYLRKSSRLAPCGPSDLTPRDYL